MDKEINNNGYEYVDLGLPSGTLWASCNIGALKSSDAGLYFQWGDTQGYTKEQIGKDKQFTWNDYKFKIKENSSSTKEQNGQKSSFNLFYSDKKPSKFNKYKDRGDTLELKDDAAHVNMGGDWHMPSTVQIQELIDNTTSEWATRDGVNGKLFTSKKDASKSIFIPAVGYAWQGSVYNTGEICYAWSSILSDKYPTHGMAFNFFLNCVCLSYFYRDLGFPIRGVLDKKSNNSKDKKNNTTMDKEINLVEILKNAPEGTKLWSSVCGVCYFRDIALEEGCSPLIVCSTMTCNSDFKKICFTKEGKRNFGYADGECVLFPSKENRDWTTFKIQKSRKHFAPYQKVLVGLIGNGKRVWKRDVYMYYREDIERHRTVFESMVPDELIIPYDANKDGKPVNSK